MATSSKPKVVPSGPPVVNPGPKSRFMESAARISAHRNLMQRDDLQLAMDFALLEHQRVIMDRAVVDMAGAAAGYYRMMGAWEYLRELKTLAESQHRVARPPTDNLKHNV